jgi:AcrR family transcriptional regulator
MSDKKTLPVPKSKDGTAVRARGQNRVENILSAAKELLVEDGIGNFTLRNVSKRLDISVGNLTYYFPSKESLLQAIIEHVLEEYDLEFEREAQAFPDDPEERFKAFLSYLVQDAKKTDVQGFFYQLWGLSTHNSDAAAIRHKMYIHFAEQMTTLLEALNLDLNKQELANLGLSVITSLEGLHVVYGSSTEFLSAYKGFDQDIYRRILHMVGLDESD